MFVARRRRPVLHKMEAGGSSVTYCCRKLYAEETLGREIELGAQSVSTARRGEGEGLTLRRRLRGRYRRHGPFRNSRWAGD